jgi:mono/diheme cytochrome c family protein
MLSNPRHSTSTLKRAVDAVFGSRIAPLLSVALIIAAAHPSAAQEGPDEALLSEGKIDFEWHCTNCHGPNGKGGGPMAKLLIKPPADLTAIAKANDGTFPFWRVYQIILGKKAVPGHETFQMPEFWKRFSRDQKDWDYPLPPHVRVVLLTHYVETLQKQ